MNICEKINFIKQANNIFNYELSRMRYSSNSWKTIIKSLTVEEIVSDEFNDFLVDTINTEELKAVEIKIPSKDTDYEIKKAAIFNIFCLEYGYWMDGKRFNENEYYGGNFRALDQKSTPIYIPTKSYGPVIEKFVNNIAKLEQAGFLCDLYPNRESLYREDIMFYVDLWSRRFGTDREFKILEFIIDNGLSKYFDDDKFKYIDRLLSILCSSHPRALEIKEKVENDPYLKNRFTKYMLIASNPNIEKTETKFTEKGLGKIVDAIIDNKDIESFIKLLDTVEKTYAGKNEKIYKTHKRILSKLFTCKQLRYVEDMSCYFNNFNKLLNPNLPYYEILKELVYEEINSDKINNYYKKREIENHMGSVFYNSDIMEKLDVYKEYTKNIKDRRYITSFYDIFLYKGNTIDGLKYLFSEWNKRRKEGTLIEEDEKLFYSIYNSTMDTASSPYRDSYADLIGDLSNISLYDSLIEKFIIYYFLIKDSEDFLELYLYYKENKKGPSLLFYLENEEVKEYKPRSTNILTTNNKETYPIFMNISYVIFLCMFKKLISEHECLDSLYDPLHEFICFNAKCNPSLLSILVNSPESVKQNNCFILSDAYKKACCAYQNLIVTCIILSRNYSSLHELENEILKEENEKIIASSYPAIISEEGLPVYRSYVINEKTSKRLSIDLIKSLVDLKSLYGENYKIETLKILLDEIFDHLFNGEYMDYLLNNAENFASYNKEFLIEGSVSKDLVTYLKDFTHNLNVDYLVDTYSKFFDIDKNFYNEKTLMKFIDDSSTILGLIDNTNSH